MDAAGRVDLATENAKQLWGAGVPEAQISTVGSCTYCDAERFLFLPARWRGRGADGFVYSRDGKVEMTLDPAGWDSLRHISRNNSGAAAGMILHSAPVEIWIKRR
jgi:hypothetical protein